MEQEMDASRKERDRRRAVGGRIKALRLERGWTQETLAEKSGVEQGSISRFESGSVTPRLQIAEALGDALGCGVDYILKGNRSMAAHDLQDLDSTLHRAASRAQLQAVKNLSDADRKLLARMFWALVQDRAASKPKPPKKK